MKTIFILFLGIILAVFTIIMISYDLFFKEDNLSIATEQQSTLVVDDPINQQEIVPLQDTILSFGAEIYSAVTIKQDRHTESVTEGGLYKNSVSEEHYNIFFFEPSGTVTILLYKEPLGFSRSLAEQQLKTILPYSNVELCNMKIKVWVNENVNKQYSSQNLGLSFCPLSTGLN